MMAFERHYALLWDLIAYMCHFIISLQLVKPENSIDEKVWGEMKV